MDDIQADLMLLRGLVARELETINHYRELATACADKGVRDFFLHIVDEEKFHIADTLRAIATIDLDQSDLLRIGYTDGHVPGYLPAESVADLRFRSLETFCQASVEGSAGNPPTSKLEEHSATVLRVDSIPSGLSDGMEETQIHRSEATLNRPNSWTVGSLRGIPQSQ